MKTAEQMLAPVERLAGERETGSGNNTTVNKFWGVDGQAYCVYTILYADKKSGASIIDGYNGSGNCRPLGEYLTAKGYRLSDNSKAQKGDIAFFCQYNEKEKRWMYQHVFFVYENLGNNIFITLEGNAKVFSTVEKAKMSTAGTGAYEGIGYKKRSMPTSSVWAIFHPPYGSAVVDDKNVPVSVRQLQQGSVGADVRAWQVLLNAAGADCGTADGDFGAKTKNATILWQKANGLAADGIVGAKSWSARLGVK